MLSRGNEFLVLCYHLTLGWSSGDAAFLAKISGGSERYTSRGQLDLETVSAVASFFAMETWPVYEYVSCQINSRNVHSKSQHLKVSITG